MAAEAGASAATLLKEHPLFCSKMFFDFVEKKTVFLFAKDSSSTGSGRRSEQYLALTIHGCLVRVPPRICLLKKQKAKVVFW